MKKGKSNTIRFLKTIAATGIVLAGINAQAATICYTLDKLPLDTQYEAGSVVNAEHVTVNFHPYYSEDLVPVQDPGNAVIIDTNILGTAPTLRLASKILMQVMPNQRVRQVTVEYAENTGADNNQVVNLGVNGAIRSWRGTLSEQDGQHIGKRDYGGRVNISVTQQPHGTGNWVKGTVTLVSDPVNPNIPNRGIDRFAFGRSSQLLIDNICMETF